MTDDRLDDAYLRMHHAGPEWGEDRLTNHGPMAVETLIRRGHGDRVTMWIDRYLTRLDDLPTASAAISDATWREALGDGRRIADWTAYFGRQVDERPWRDVLALWWPRLLPGIVAGATHGVIRVGHAVRALLGDDGDGSGPGVAELAHGLAFWAARFQGVPGTAAPAGRLDAATALQGIPALAVQQGTVATRLARLPGMAGWTSGLAALRAPATPDEAQAVLADLVTAGTRQYLSHGHASPVLLVHAATAPNAVLHTLPALPRELWAPSLGAVWSAAAALSAAYAPQTGAAPAQLPALVGANATASVFNRAAEHGDEHVIKFTDTAIEVYERTGDPAALAAAVRTTTLIDPPQAA
jgi:hypothetical protein